jgi:hypothetical protein
MKYLSLTLLGLFLFSVSYAISPIAGAFTVCIGSTTALSDATMGGTWSSSSPAIASVGSATGITTGIAVGIVTITYSVGASYVTTAVTVNSNPALITGVATACGIDSITVLSDATPGGIWSSSNPAVGTVGSLTGIVTGVGYGPVIISYNVPTGCRSTINVVVISMLPIVGPSSVCVGDTILLGSLVPGTWSTSALSIATVDSGVGEVTGIAFGTVTIRCTFPACYSEKTITVNPVPSAITGVTNICGAGTTTTLSDITPGGIWSSAGTGTVTVGSGSGIVTGVSLGTAVISYANPSTSCNSTIAITVNSLPSAISGTFSVCEGSSTTLSDATSGGTWSSGGISIATIGSGTGVTTGIASGTAVISYTLLSLCFSTVSLTVNPLPAITATATPSCGGTYTLSGSGGATYVWSPASGLSCTSCSITYTNPTATTSYTVAGTDGAGCSNTTSVSVDGNRISGYISLSSIGSIKVWLIQFNPIDSTITTLDSTMVCLSGGIPYYEFDGKPMGNYLIKAFLLGGTPGSSGYIPTYGLSSPHWDSATTVAHSSSTDTMHINMVYGTVPSGIGFISGYVLSGAGKGTSGEIPAPGMLIYLKDATTNNIVTYTYTDNTGAYSFNGLGNGSYKVYPEEYKYYTTSSDLITLTTTSGAITGISFKQHTLFGTITPFDNTGTNLLSANGKILVFPNPANDALTITGLQENTNYRLMTVTGNYFMQGTLGRGTNTIPMQKVAAGIYVLEMIGVSGERSIVRVVKE